MGIKHPDRYAPEDWRFVAETVGAMIRRGWQVKTRCRKCRVELAANLYLTAAILGPHYSLWNRTPRCKVVGCAGVADFWALPPETVNFVQLRAAWPAGSPHPRPPDASPSSEP